MHSNVDIVEDRSGDYNFNLKFIVYFSAIHKCYLSKHLVALEVIYLLKVYFSSGHLTLKVECSIIFILYINRAIVFLAFLFHLQTLIIYNKYQ